MPPTTAASSFSTIGISGQATVNNVGGDFNIAGDYNVYGSMPMVSCTGHIQKLSRSARDASCANRLLVHMRRSFLEVERAP
ncbi:hypothetical protein FIBSPDRAFT_267791 [Athelia psychrophila]|uniref:Uncharacterized protein n=1 Tax=Athelia psychrophila TaxID=1759441 RepID=A0A166RHH5_9AGAM|nr:hypothetical protein FIBSPDRAFT_267791 [Fibularhizoctonia sp. CBS 109695]